MDLVERERYNDKTPASLKSDDDDRLALESQGYKVRLGIARP